MIEKQQADRGSRRGTALTAALVVVMGIAALSAYMIQVQASMARRQATSIDTRAALYVAEAGLAEAAFQISQGKGGQIGSVHAPAGFHRGKYWVDAEELDDGTISLTSTGLAGRSRFRVNLEVTPNKNPVASLGLFGDEGVMIGDRVLVDGFDANEGTLRDQRDGAFDYWTTGKGALVGSNGDITVDDGVLLEDPWVEDIDRLPGELPRRFHRGWIFARGGQFFRKRYDWGADGTWPTRSEIFGAAVAGPAGLVQTSPSTLLMDAGSREEEAILPDVLLPADLEEPVAGTWLVRGNVRLRRKGLSLEELWVLPGMQLVLEGPLVVHFGKLVVAPGAGVVIDDDKGSVTVFISNELDFRRGSYLRTIKEDERSEGSTFLVARPVDPADDRRVQFDCFGCFRGVIFAPGDRLSVGPGMRVMGSLVAKHLTLEDGAWVTVDKSLEVGGVGLPALPRRMRWTAMAVDAGEVGAAVAAAPTDPRDLTPEQDLEMVYVDHGDVTRSYTGSLSGLDLSQVARILAVRWIDSRTGAPREWEVPPGASPEDVIAHWRRKLRAARAGA